MKKNPWPYAIIAYFAVFITAMASWITFAVRNDMELVRKDYYEADLKFQQQLDKLARTRELRRDISVRLEGPTLALVLPKTDAQGEVHLYRPSNAKLDRRLPLQLDAQGRQAIDIARLQSGLWKLRVSWQSHGEDFYFDEPIVIP
jgi:hypothetical protein